MYLSVYLWVCLSVTNSLTHSLKPHVCSHCKNEWEIIAQKISIQINASRDIAIYLNEANGG